MLNVRSDDITSQKKSDKNEQSHFDVGKRGKIDPHLICLNQPNSAEAEYYARLRLAVERHKPDDKALVVGITSPGPGDGKTTTAINLAGSIAQSSAMRVLLIDLNLRKPGKHITDFLDLKSLVGPGVSDLLAGSDVNMEDAIRYLPGLNLSVMSSGNKIGSSYGLLNSKELESLIAEVTKKFDFVIVDSPQMLPMPDTELIARVIDGFVIVVKAAETSRKNLAEALNIMSQEQVMGLVFNASTDL